MLEKKKIVKISMLVLVILFFVFGIPIIINECYKVDCGYPTKWDASAMLGYYGAILGAIITIITLVTTIAFTKKQIQRESFLKKESEKWYKLKTNFLEILKNINPILILKDVMENGFINPTKAIHSLQSYQIICQTSTDLLNAHLSMDDFPKVEHLIDSIAEIAEEFVNISSEEIKLYSDFRLLQSKDSSYQMLHIEEAHPGTFSKENLAANQEIIEKLKTISGEEINSKVKYYNSEFIKVYKSKYRKLLQNIGATFEELEFKTMRDADCLLNFCKNTNSKLLNNKSNENKKV